MFVKGLKEGKAPAIALAAILGIMALPLIESAIGAIFTAFSMIPFGLGIPLAAIAVGGLFSLLAKSKSQTTVNDGVFPAAGGSGYGKRVLTGPEGSIQLNNKDTVIAGTNLFGDDVKSSPNKPTQMGEKGEIKVKSEGGDMSAVIAAINNLASRPIQTSVQIDRKEVAIASQEEEKVKYDANPSKYYRIQ
jgi:hypothetical protein